MLLENYRHSVKDILQKKMLSAKNSDEIDVFGTIFLDMVCYSLSIIWLGVFP